MKMRKNSVMKSKNGSKTFVAIAPNILCTNLCSSPAIQCNEKSPEMKKLLGSINEEHDRLHIAKKGSHVRTLLFQTPDNSLSLQNTSASNVNLQQDRNITFQISTSVVSSSDTLILAPSVNYPLESQLSNNSSRTDASSFNLLQGYNLTPENPPPVATIDGVVEPSTSVPAVSNENDTFSDTPTRTFVSNPTFEKVCSDSGQSSSTISNSDAQILGLTTTLSSVSNRIDDQRYANKSPRSAKKRAKSRKSSIAKPNSSGNAASSRKRKSSSTAETRKSRRIMEKSSLKNKNENSDFVRPSTQSSKSKRGRRSNSVDNAKVKLYDELSSIIQEVERFGKSDETCLERKDNTVQSDNSETSYENDGNIGSSTQEEKRFQPLENAQNSDVAVADVIPESRKEFHSLAQDNQPVEVDLSIKYTSGGLIYTYFKGSNIMTTCAFKDGEEPLFLPQSETEIPEATDLSLKPRLSTKDSSAENARDLSLKLPPNKRKIYEMEHERQKNENVEASTSVVDEPSVTSAGALSVDGEVAKKLTSLSTVTPTDSIEAALNAQDLSSQEKVLKTCDVNKQDFVPGKLVSNNLILIQ